MIRKLQPIFSPFFLTGMMWLYFTQINAQPLYYISGSTEAFCGREEDYSIVGDSNLLQTQWRLIPTGNADIYYLDTYSFGVIFNATGTYMLISTSWSANNGILSDTLVIEVVGGLQGLEISGCFEMNPITACYQVCAFSQTIIYFEQGDEISITGALDYTYINGESIEVTWGPSGTGLVKIYSSWCSFSQCFEILPQPFADFNTNLIVQNDTLTICKGQEIQFFNQSFNGLDYIWTFGDGGESQSFDAAHSFISEGYYTVTLTAKTICDCEAQKQIVIEVLAAPVPTLDCVNTVCEETHQKYTASTDGCTQFNWTISGNGTIINGGGPSDDFIEVIWHEGPDGYIYLSVGGCSSTYCSAVNTFRIPIISPNASISGDEQVCTGEVVAYTVPYFPGTQYQWSAGTEGAIMGGQNTNGVTIRWSDVNMITPSFVSVEYENCFLDCSGSATLPVSITPEIRIDGDVQVCQNSTASIVAEAGFFSQIPADMGWHIINELGEIVYTYPGISSSFIHSFSYPAGEYEWVATNSSSSYCTEVVRQKIIVTATPSSPLGIEGETHICPGQPYGFTIIKSGEYATNWIVTDGGSITEYKGRTIAHTFGNSPPYSVQAVHADIQYPDCVSPPVTHILETSENLVIEGMDDVCFNGINEFSIPYVSGAEYVWEIIPAENGEIKKSDLNQVEVFWTKTGPATLRLHTCGHIKEKPVFVHDLPAFNLLGPMAVCENELAALTTDQPALSFAWFTEENNFISDLDAVSLSTGVYSISGRDAYECESRQSFQITALPVPQIHLTTAAHNLFCNVIPGGVELVVNTDGSDYSFTWYKDDILIGPGGPVYIVTDFGTYHAEVINQYGCKALSGKITFTNCCAPADCSGPGGGTPGCIYPGHDFDIIQSELECQTQQYTPLWPDIIPDETTWFVSSNSLGTIAVVNADILTQHYLYPGYYHITMIGKLNGFPYSPVVCGHLQKITDTIEAVADFTFEHGCIWSMIAFEDLTTFLPDKSIAGWHWDFGDPSSGPDNQSMLQDPTHIYAAAGEYDVLLSVTMLSGCTTTKTLKVQISAGPVLLPVYDPVYCEKEALSFRIPGDVFDVAWDFGDIGSGIQNTAISDSVFHTYDIAGIYSVTVAASDARKCRSQNSFMVDIRTNTLSGTIGIDPMTLLCFGDTANLSSPAGGLTWLWSTGEMAETIDIVETNQYNVLVLDQFQCTYSPPPVFVSISSPPEIIIKAREILGPNVYGSWASTLQICHGTEFEIQVFSPSLNTYYWLHGPTDETLSFTAEAGNLPGPGLNQYSVIADNGCLSDITTIDIEIFNLPLTPVIALWSGSGCGQNQNVLQVNNPEPGIEYHWSDGQTGTSIITELAGIYLVTAINQHGCSAKSNNIHILPSSDISKIPGGCFIACDPLTVCLPPFTDVVYYNLYLNGVLFQSGTTWPDEIVLTQDGSYTFEVTSSNGCVALSEPLDIILYIGTGSITVLTFFDTDGDGMLSASDELLPGIPVNIISDDGLNLGATHTNNAAQFVFEDFPSSVYTVSVNSQLLSPQWKIIIDSVLGEIQTCDDSIVVSLLLGENCFVTGPDLNFEICPGEIVSLGDSSWSDTGHYVMHLMSVLGCDSTIKVEILYRDSLEIKGIVWVDLDQNGMVSPADTIIHSIALILEDLVTSDQYTLISGIPNLYPDGWYSLSIDTGIFSGQFIVIEGTHEVNDTSCGSVQINFLVEPTCPHVQLIQQMYICEGDSVFIHDTWISNPGVYSFQITDQGALCDTTLDVHVSLYPELSIEATTSWNCVDLGTISLEVIGDGPFQFYWNVETIEDTIATGLIPGEYNVSISDVHGCMLTDTNLIEVPPASQFFIDDYFEVVLGDSILLHITGDTASSNVTYHWYPSNIIDCNTCVSTIAYPVEDVMLNIDITDAYQCVYTLHTHIVVTLIDTLVIDVIYAPNVFSPNGDNINDRFSFFGRLPDIYLYELTLLDRWGETVFYTGGIPLDAFEGWDGTFRDKPLNPQVFAYFAKVRLSDGRELKLVGDVTLIR